MPASERGGLWNFFACAGKLCADGPEAVSSSVAHRMRTQALVLRLFTYDEYDRRDYQLPPRRPGPCTRLRQSMLAMMALAMRTNTNPPECCRPGQYPLPSRAFP